MRGRTSRPAIPRPRIVRRRAKPTCATEHQEQATLIRWCRASDGTWPELQLVTGIPNGGARHPVVAAKMKAEGTSAGFPDLILPVARGGYFGLFIELKRREGGRLSTAQEWWRARLECRGYRWALGRGWDEARDVLVEYLSKPPTQVLPRYSATARGPESANETPKATTARKAETPP